MALQKTPLLCGTMVPTDLRVYLMHRMTIMSVSSSRVFIYPRMYALHNMAPDVGQPAPAAEHGEGNAHIKMPVLCNLTNESIQSDGVFLMENGMHIMIWVGRAVAPATLMAIFGVDRLDNIPDTSTLRIQGGGAAAAAAAAAAAGGGGAAPGAGGDLGLRVHNIVTAMRDRRSLFLRTIIVREGDPLEPLFQMHLYDDRKNFAGGNLSYREYAAIVERNTSIKIL